MAEKKNAAAVELGRRGGKVKTKKGFGVMSEAERKAAGAAGAAARWGKKKKKKRAPAD